jgi:hypothetical protein
LRYATKREETMNPTAYDVIGDIHGHLAKLEALLVRLGYVQFGGVWTPPEGRMALFLGDLIDRGPEQVAVVRAVRAMVEAGHALCLMGNHEYNAIAYATPRNDAPGEYLRTRSAKNREQHGEFLRQVGEGSALHGEIIEWFRTLPPVLDLGGLRAVHAWWHEPHVQQIGSLLDSGWMDDDFLHAACTRESPLWHAMEELTKGLELPLPDGHVFVDHQGVARREVRTRWWLEEPSTFRDVAIVGNAQEHRVPEVPLPANYRGGPVEGSPIFVGHYWMEGAPVPMSNKVACLDWGAGKAGPLVAYRWDGEQEIDAGKFVVGG